MKKNEFKSAIRNTYKAVNALHKTFPIRKFTLDGKIMGDIGEALAAIHYRVHLDEKSRKDWDGCWKDSNGNRKEVQIRATQCDTTYLKKPPRSGSLLIFKIDREKMGEYKTVYNGDIMFAWKTVKNQKSKEKTISIDNLGKLQKNVSTKDKIPRR